MTFAEIARQPRPVNPELPAWALELAKQAVLLQAGQKHSMLTVRFDGLSWQIFVATPAMRMTKPGK